MYLSVTLSVVCPAASLISIGDTPHIAKCEQNV
jgi:hypothetical protein